MIGTNDGGPAFPMQDHSAIHAWAQARIEKLCLETTAERDAAYIQARAEAIGGMSLRDYFAAKAMQGMLACEMLRATEQEFSERAYSIADAMLRARDQS